MTPGFRSAALALALAGVVLPGSGCRPAEGGLMVRIPPPRDWEEQLASYRGAKDEYYRSSPDTPLLAGDLPGFAGLDYWDLDPRLYFVGPIHAYRTPEQMMILTTAGQPRPAEKYGYVQLRLKEQVETLQVLRLIDSDPLEGVEGLFLAFYDETSGKETYPAGRYVDFLGQDGGPYVLDFNLAFNPSCAYGAPERFACPRAPAENRLSSRIEAGERGYRRES